MDALRRFREIWAVDTEFRRSPGGLPDPVCCVCAVELRTGREVQIWTEHGAHQPFDTGPSNLFVAQYSSAEWLSFIVLGWAPPVYVVDTYVEGRVLTNGLPGRKGNDDRREGRQRRCGLLHLAVRYGISSMSDATKDANRELAMRGGSWTHSERRQMLRYCLDDAKTCAAVFKAMLPEITMRRHGLAQALLRGRYMRACARIEQFGMPIDIELLETLKANWRELRAKLIEATDPGRYDCFDGGAFKRARFEALLERLGIRNWPRTGKAGFASLEGATFRDMAALHPELADLRELYSTLQQLKDFDLGVGPDGRHRADMLSPFGTDTARHAPRKFVFALARWFRALLKPVPGTAIVYSDFAAQEIRIAAWLSQDPALIEAVESGDPYLWFLVRIGRAPEGATKASHKDLRDWVKPLLLGVHYGMTAHGAAARLGVSLEEAARLLDQHKRSFPTYWAWSADKIAAAAELGEMVSRWGWRLKIPPGVSQRTLRNHPIQTMGAHILHFTGIGLTESGIRVCCPVHDAVVTECSIAEVDAHVSQVQAIMRQAARSALGTEIPVDSEVIHYPDRYIDKRGKPLFDKVIRSLSKIEPYTHSEQKGGISPIN
jgi:DNA polymerase I-like protein with 3'-5' exonuclease and polymerase domains